METEGILLKAPRVTSTITSLSDDTQTCSRTIDAACSSLVVFFLVNFSPVHRVCITEYIFPSLGRAGNQKALIYRYKPPISAITQVQSIRQNCKMFYIQFPVFLIIHYFPAQISDTLLEVPRPHFIGKILSSQVTHIHVQGTGNAFKYYRTSDSQFFKG